MGMGLKSVRRGVRTRWRVGRIFWFSIMISLVCFYSPVGSSDRGGQEMPRPALDNRNIAAASTSLRGVCSFAQTQSQEGVQTGSGGLDEGWRRSGTRSQGPVVQSGVRGVVEAHKKQQQQQSCDKAEGPKRGGVTRKRSAKGSGGSVCSFLGCSNPIMQNSSSSVLAGESGVDCGGGGKGGGRGRGRPASFACAEHQDWYERVSRKGQACQHRGCTTQASYGDLISRIPTSCAQHKAPHEQHLHATMCRVADCTRFATYGPPSSRGGGARPVACQQHKLSSHVDVRNKMCEETGCAVQASFGPPETGKACRCATHRLDRDSDVRNAGMKCQYANGCTKRASYGPMSTLIPVFCSEHKEESQINTRNGRCGIKGCPNYASYFDREGLRVGRVTRRCHAHRQGYTHVSVIRSEASALQSSARVGEAAGRGTGLENKDMQMADSLFLSDADDAVSSIGRGEPGGMRKVGPEGRFDIFFQMQKIKKMAHEASASLDDIMSGKITIKELENLDPDEEGNDGLANDDFNPWALPRFDTDDASFFASTGVNSSGYPSALETELPCVEAGDSLSRRGSEDRGFGIDAFKHRAQGKGGAAFHDFAQEFPDLAGVGIQAWGPGSVVEALSVEVEGHPRDDAMKATRAMMQ